MNYDRNDKNNENIDEDIDRQFIADWKIKTKYIDFK